MRLFVAIDVGDAARELIAAEQRRLGEALGARRTSLKWVRTEHIHLTLVFLGETEEGRAHDIVDAIGKPIEHQPFEIHLGGLGVFPPGGAPRVLWLGVSSGAREVTDVQRIVARRLAELDVPLEDRPFHPHLTLARWRDARPADRRRVIDATRDVEVGRAHVTAVTLFQSRLSSSGPAYTALARGPLI